MKYISVEEFLKQPEEVRKVFIEWWQCEIGDLFAFDGDDDRDLNILQVVGSENQITMTKVNKGESRIPLFTEGQLREFILDKTKMHCVEVKMVYSSFKHTIIIRNGDLYWEFKEVDRDLLQALWKVALKVAKEIVAND
jgi:hypothetical protein